MGEDELEEGGGPQECREIAAVGDDRFGFSSMDFDGCEGACACKNYCTIIRVSTYVEKESQVGENAHL